METWKSVPGFEGVEASSEGRIRRSRDQKILNWSYSGRSFEYPRVVLSINPKRRGVIQSTRKHCVHILVAKTFIGECPPGYEHNHKDGNKANPAADNLEFVTRSQNQQHSIHQLGHPTARKGTHHGMCKLTDDDVREIHRLRAERKPIRVIADQFGVKESRVSTIARGRGWTHLALPDLGRFKVI